MKKITSKKLTQRLAQYGAMSAAVMAAADANGQVVYTDLEPDLVIDVAGQFDLDFTNDTFVNITIANPDGLAGGNAAIVFTSSGGALAGFTSAGYQYPFLMAADDAIDAATGYTATGARGDLNYYGCAYSNSQWCGDVTDGYLGVKFLNLSTGTTHYGWVRMDTDVGGDNLMVVKDYAFEATPDTGIAAGDQGSLGLNDTAFDGFKYLVDSANNLSLRAASALEQVVLHNVLGQEIMSRQLSGTNESISLASLETGVYIATVNIEGQTKSFQIVKR
jgi:hypothetical protein